MSGLSAELKRKGFHLLSLLYAALYAAAGREASLWTLGAAFMATAAVEAARLRRPALNARLMGFFGGIHREKEATRPSGILWTQGGAFLTILLVPHRDVVLAGLWCLALGDAAAALVGQRWGHIRLGGKSLEGSGACFLACWASGALFLASPAGNVPEAAVGALAAAVVEALSPPPDDNLWMPVVYGLSLAALRLL